MKLTHIAVVLSAVGFLLGGILYWRDVSRSWVGPGDFASAHDFCHYESLKHASWGAHHTDLYAACMKLRGWERK